MKEAQYNIEKTTSTPASEAYRILRTKVLLLSAQTRLKTILITSAVRREGKSTVAKNFAMSLALMEKNVVLLDGDLRMSTLTHNFSFPEQKGLTDLLAVQEAGFKECLLWLIKHLDFIGAGMPTPDPVERLASSRMKSFLQELQSAYDFVIIDSPALLDGVADAQIMASLVDGVILVVCPDKASLDMVQSAKKVLTEANTAVIGVALNQVKEFKCSYPQSRLN
jgi:capsular exopolysaccharide synthesis family protein